MRSASHLPRRNFPWARRNNVRCKLLGANPVRLAPGLQPEISRRRNFSLDSAQHAHGMRTACGELAVAAFAVGRQAQTAAGIRPCSASSCQREEE